MEKMPSKKQIIAVVGEGATLSSAALEYKKEHTVPNIEAVSTEVSTQPQVKQKPETRKYINGVEHYLTIVGEWKPVLYSTKAPVSANE